MTKLSVYRSLEENDRTSESHQNDLILFSIEGFFSTNALKWTSSVYVCLLCDSRSVSFIVSLQSLFLKIALY